MAYNFKGVKKGDFVIVYDETITSIRLKKVSEVGARTFKVSFDNDCYMSFNISNGWIYGGGRWFAMPYNATNWRKLKLSKLEKEKKKLVEEVMQINFGKLSSNTLEKILTLAMQDKH